MLQLTLCCGHVLYPVTVAVCLSVSLHSVFSVFTACLSLCVAAACENPAVSVRLPISFERVTVTQEWKSAESPIFIHA